MMKPLKYHVLLILLLLLTSTSMLPIKAVKGVASTDANEKQRSYYDLLELKADASIKEIKKAYRVSALKNHPDKFQGVDDKKEAERTFVAIVAAYEVLIDEEKRKRYDELLDQGIFDFYENKYSNFRNAYQKFEEDLAREQYEAGVQLILACVSCVVCIGLPVWYMRSIQPKKKVAVEMKPPTDFFVPTEQKTLGIVKQPVFLTTEEREQGLRDAERVNKFKIRQFFVKQVKQFSKYLNSTLKINREEVDELLVDVSDEVLALIVRDMLPSIDIDSLLPVAEQVEQIQQYQSVSSNSSKLKEPESTVVLVKHMELMREKWVEQSKRDKLAHEERQREMKQQEQDAKCREIWSVEEMSMLAKAMAKFPGGTPQRWEVICKEVNRASTSATSNRSLKEVIAKVKDMDARKLVRRTFGETAIDKKEDTLKTTETGSISDDDIWSAEQQTQLEHALRSNPRIRDESKNADEVKVMEVQRWHQISTLVQGKTSQQCKRRFKEICQKIKSKQ